MKEKQINVVKKNVTFPSAAGGCDIEAVRWLPADGDVRAVMQIGHGMLEHIGRYDAFTEYYVRRGIAVYGSTHLGHGMSINKDYPRGYFGKQNDGGAVFLKDLKQMMDIARADYPDVPYVYFGYSMGTFLGRMLLAERGDQVDAAVLCSTGIPDFSMRAMIPMLKLLPSFLDKKPAPAILVECASGDRTMICGQSARSMDGAIAMSYMTLEAVSLGMQFCWLGWFQPEKVRALLNIPEDYVVIAVAPPRISGSRWTSVEKEIFG